METWTDGRQDEEIWGEDSHLLLKERTLEQILPSQPSEGTNTANTLILNFWTPELRDTNFLLFKPPSLAKSVQILLGMSPKARDVARSGIKPATSWCKGQLSPTDWAVIKNSMSSHEQDATSCSRSG
uniref:Uncharacterized protein n=1 Tax=Myotis myotis TaxID=51298 RepID=A0A7J7TJ59_MYOMY|nr:hypothetical protein mMyoMyo1_009036 [Myotis myotis]